jgi:hypothetical protein
MATFRVWWVRAGQVQVGALDLHLGAALVELGRGDKAGHGQELPEVLLKVHHAGGITRLVHGDKFDFCEGFGIVNQRSATIIAVDQVGMAVRQAALVGTVKVSALLKQSERSSCGRNPPACPGHTQDQTAEVAIVHLQPDRLAFAGGKAHAWLAQQVSSAS